MSPSSTLATGEICRQTTLEFINYANDYSQQLTQRNAANNEFAGLKKLKKKKNYKVNNIVGKNYV